MAVFNIADGFDRMDFDKVTQMLQTVWWSPGIPKAEVIQGAKNSAILVGAWLENGEQVGFSRAVSDKTRFAYIMDVVVDDRFRKQGIGQSMVRYMLNSPEMKDVYQWMLMTLDAHGVYSKLGFRPISNTDKWMEIRHERSARR